ncbi:hypothetical protein LN650_23740 [Klebsiella pneumoniae subsp. pneumoniae]|nr:hypothetical protein [Klebsiella pneumoniae subsp. pneumoniae]
MLVTSTRGLVLIQFDDPGGGVAWPRRSRAYLRAGGEGAGAAGRFNSIRWVNGRGVGLQPDEDVIAWLGCAQRLASAHRVLPGLPSLHKPMMLDQVCVCE